LKVSSISDAGYFLRKTHSQTLQAIEDTIEAINLTAKLGAESLVIITGVGGSFFRSPEQDWQIVVRALREVSPVAEACGVKLAIEAVNQSRYPGNTFLCSIPDVLKLLDEIRSPAVGLCFDFDHLWEEPNLKSHIADARGRIFAVHLCDMPRQPKPPFDRRIPGEGEAPLEEIMSALVEADYNGYFDLEILSLDLWARDYLELINQSHEAFTCL
jgi:sugar phosphate isomerase/epimerase